MLLWLVSFALMVSASFAEVGKISKILGSGDAYVLRNQNKISVVQDLELEQGDEIHSLDSVVMIYLYPTTQMNLAKNSQIKITENLVAEAGEKEKVSSVIDFIKGLVRVQVTRDESLEIEQKVQANGVAFAVRGTEFEVSEEGEDFDLDVIEGEVEVMSPYVNTFVPEIVKANEGFRFNKKQRNFQRRKFRAKFKNQPGFAGKEEVKAKWKQQKLARKQKRLNKKDIKDDKRSDRMNQRNERKKITQGQRKERKQR